MSQTRVARSAGDAVSDPAAFDLMLARVAERREEFCRLRHVPRDMVEEFKNVGIFRAATPREFGGDALPPADFLRMIERISEVDASAGWVASFGSATTYLAALPRDSFAELFADGPDLVFAGGLFPVQPAEPVPGGYRVSGRWKFASGCQGADVLGVGIGVGDASSGKPRTALLRPHQVEIVEQWDVVGLQGTGSHDLKVDGAVVPEEHTFVRGGRPSVDEPLYHYPTMAYAAQVLAVVNLGVARAALDHVVRAGGARSITGSPSLAERPYYRITAAKAEAALRSVRAFFYDTTEEVYASVAAGDPATPDQGSLLRLAAAHVAHVGFEVVRTAYNLSGTSAIHSAHPMQRYLRDASVVPQHAFLNEGMYDNAGSVLLGRAAAPGYL